MIRRMKNGDMVQPSNLEKDNYQIKEDGIFISDSQRKRYQKIKEAKKYNEAVRQFSKEHGGFTLLRITDTYKQLDPATVGRLAFLSTYLNFGNTLLITDDNLPMMKRNLYDVLCISKPTADSFYKECIANNLMADKQEDGLYLNDLYFHRGKVEDGSDKQAKLYCDTIRSLYRKMPAKSHKYFGYVIQLVPWINSEWNIVCRNPEEVDSDLIIPMNLTEICELLEIDTNHVARFHKALTEPIFEFNEERQQLCASIRTKATQGMQQTIYINPHLIYSGSDYRNVEGISVAFRPHKKAKAQKKAV